MLSDLEPEVIVHTDRESLDESVAALIGFIRPRLKTDMDVEI